METNKIKRSNLTTNLTIFHNIHNCKINSNALSWKQIELYFNSLIIIIIIT